MTDEADKPNSEMQLPAPARGKTSMSFFCGEANVAINCEKSTDETSQPCSIFEHASSEAEDIPLQPRPTGCPVPLTTLQLRSLDARVTRGTRLSEMRMSAGSARVLGPLNADLLRTSLETVVQRHESLRTRIVMINGIPRQHVEAPFDFRPEIIDLAAVRSGNVDTEARRLAQEFIDAKVDLSTGPLFEAKLFRLSEREHLLILALDHIVSDGVSFGILGREIWTLYHQAAQHRALSLPQLPVQFADYAVWQERTYDAWRKKHEAYWRERLAGAPHLQLPVRKELADIKPSTVAMMTFHLGQGLSAALRDVARREQTLLPLAVLTVFAAAISLWCNQRDLVIALVSHGRHRYADLTNMIGLVANSFYLRIEITDVITFLDLLAQVTQEFYAACQHQDYDRVPDLIPECPTGLGFNWTSPYPTTRAVHRNSSFDNQVELQPYPVQTSSPHMDPSLKLVAAPSDTATGIVIDAWYRLDLFAPSTIEQLGRHLQRIAEELTRCPLTAIASILRVS